MFTFYRQDELKMSLFERNLNEKLVDCSLGENIRNIDVNALT